MFNNVLQCLVSCTTIGITASATVWPSIALDCDNGAEIGDNTTEIGDDDAGIVDIAMKVIP